MSLSRAIVAESALLAEAEALGYPLVVKSYAGGRGRGTALAHTAHDLLAAVRRSSAQAQAAYRNGQIHLEAAILPSRYIEVPKPTSAHRSSRGVHSRILYH